MIKKTKVSESAETSAVRREQIVRELRRNGAVEVDALAARHSTSSSTIRRDLAELERAGLLHRTHGGAVLIEQFLYEPFRHVSSFQEQEQERAKEKRLIGQAAAELVADGETVAIGTELTDQPAAGFPHRSLTTSRRSHHMAKADLATKEISIPVDGALSVSGLWQPVSRPIACLVLAHGAGAGMQTFDFAGGIGTSSRRQPVPSRAVRGTSKVPSR